MALQSANDQTVIKLFAAYSRQGIQNQMAIRLIAVSCSMTQKAVREILARNAK
jgi:hypothetical protein